jgi:hypothetical protein
MNTVLKALTLAAVIAGGAAAPASAQQKAWGFGIHTGWTDNGRLAETDLQDRHLKLDNGWNVGGDLEWWFGSRRVGFRLEGTYMKQPFIIDREPDPANPTNPAVPADEEQEVLQGYTGVNTLFADGDLMIRLLPTTVDRRFAPFINIGTGLVHFDFDRSVDAPREFTPVDAYIYGDSQTEWAVTGGVGFDLFMSESVALRLEAKDYWMTDSPILKLSDMERDHKGGHNSCIAPAWCSTSVARAWRSPASSRRRRPLRRPSRSSSRRLRRPPSASPCAWWTRTAVCASSTRPATSRPARST